MNLIKDDDGEWHGNGGSVNSPRIVWNSELVHKVIKFLEQGLQPNMRNPYGSFKDKKGSFAGWTVARSDPETLDLLKNIEYFNSTLKHRRLKASVVCSYEEEGIACLAVIKFSPNMYYVFAPNNSNSYDFIIVEKFTPSKEEALTSAKNLNLNKVDYNVDYGMKIGEFKVMLADRTTLSFKLHNTGRVPLRIKGFDVYFNERKVAFDDLLHVTGKEVDVDSNKEVVLELSDYYDNLCDLIGGKLKVVVYYDAPRFKCNYEIDSLSETSVEINRSSKVYYELIVTNPENDLFVYSAQPRVNKNNRLDLHVGYDEGVLRTFIYSKMKDIKRKDLKKAILELNVMKINGDGMFIGVYELPYDWNPEKVSWSFQPRLGKLVSKEFINRTGIYKFDITKYVLEEPGYGFALVDDNEESAGDVVFSALESDEKPKIKLYYKTNESLGELCSGIFKLQ